MLRLPKLRDKDPQVREIRSEKPWIELKKSWEEIKMVLHHKSLLYIPAIIHTKLITHH